MRVSAALRSGGRHYFYPKQVWSPAGGWWNFQPAGWENATALVAAGIFGGVVLTFNVSRSIEVRFLRNVDVTGALITLDYEYCKRVLSL